MPDHASLAPEPWSTRVIALPDCSHTVTYRKLTQEGSPNNPPPNPTHSTGSTQAISPNPLQNLPRVGFVRFVGCNWSFYPGYIPFGAAANNRPAQKFLGDFIKARPESRNAPHLPASCSRVAPSALFSPTVLPWPCLDQPPHQQPETITCNDPYNDFNEDPEMNRMMSLTKRLILTVSFVALIITDVLALTTTAFNAALHLAGAILVIPPLIMTSLE